jgi:hypothetical protein
MVRGFRIIAPEDLREALEIAATLLVSDEELQAIGAPLADHGWEDGLGPYTATTLELADGEQVALQRFEHQPECVLVRGPH